MILKYVASRGGLANRQLPSVNNSNTSSSASNATTAVTIASANSTNNLTKRTLSNSSSSDCNLDNSDEDDETTNATANAMVAGLMINSHHNHNSTSTHDLNILNGLHQLQQQQQQLHQQQQQQQQQQQHNIISNGHHNSTNNLLSNNSNSNCSSNGGIGSGIGVGGVGSNAIVGGGISNSASNSIIAGTTTAILLNSTSSSASASSSVNSREQQINQLYAQVHKDHKTSASHTGLPGLFKNSLGSPGGALETSPSPNDFHRGGMTTFGTSSRDLNSSYDSILGSNDKLSENEQSSENWMYPSRRRVGPTGAIISGKLPPTSFTEQLNQALTERER